MPTRNFINRTPLLSSRCSLLSLSVLLALHAGAACADDYFDPASVELHGNKKMSVDLSLFSKTGGQIPGVYKSEVYVNGNYVDDRNIRYEIRAGKLEPVLTKKELVTWGAEASATPTFMAMPDTEAIANVDSAIPGGRINFDFGQQRLDISIPQEYIRKSAQGYVDPKDWNDGVNMFFLNYGYSGSQSWSDYRSGRESESYVNLRSGINLGAWRLRNYSTYSNGSNKSDWNSINTYLQRDIKSLKSQLIIGESYTPSDVFDSFAFRGVQLYSDDNMQPESLRGFAPVVRGIAQSNAQVTVRQDGNIIWQSYVPPGPFAINDLYPTSASGDLEVSVREADGSVRQFIQPFSSVPIMLREGRFKYSFTAGKYRSTGEAARKPEFIQSTAIYGMPWTSTLYGGTLLSNDYQTASLGLGKSLGFLGSVSVDGTFASTTIRDENERGGSFRFQYSKDVAMSGTSFTLAGYRYSTSGYYDFDEANGYYANLLPLGYKTSSERDNDLLDRERQAYSNWRYSHNKRSKAQININQTLKDYGSLYLSAYEQQYWGISGKERSVNFGYNSSYNSINYSINYAYSTTPYYAASNQVVSFAVQIPLDRFLSRSWANFSGSSSKHGDTTSSVGLSGNALADNSLTYNVQQGYTNHGVGATGNASVDYKARFGEYQAGYSYGKDTRQLSYGAMGGVVLHPYGITFSQPLGDTLVLVRAPGAGDVKVDNNPGVYTNSAGYAVLPYITPYRRNRISLNTDNLSHNVDILHDTQTVVPTQGALALADYPTAFGQKVMFTLGGASIPFGASASVKNGDATVQGIVDDRQRVYLSGIPAQGVVQVSWGSGQCQAPYRTGPDKGPVLALTADCR